jgi:PAS domain S-box-containing protein
VKAAVERGHVWIAYRPDGTVAGMSAGFLARTGFTRDLLTGRHYREWWQRSPGDAADMWEASLAGRDAAGVVRLETRDGTVRWFRGTLVPVGGVFRRIARIVSILQDVTDEQARRAEDRSRLEALAAPWR